MIMKSELARAHRTSTHKANLTTHIKALLERLYWGLAHQHGWFQAGLLRPLKGKYHAALSLVPIIRALAPWESCGLGHQARHARPRARGEFCWKISQCVVQFRSLCQGRLRRTALPCEPCRNVGQCGSLRGHHEVGHFAPGRVCGYAVNCAL